MIERQRSARQERRSAELRSKGLTESKPCAILTVVKKEAKKERCKTMAVTVRELIAELEKIENKELDVVIDGQLGVLTDVEAIEGAHRYYGKSEAVGYVHRTRECVVLVGWE